ncbi:MAG: hypothetical protein IPM54_11465 [Polyangiaceae bacterium]|nr:hypothetical protein [Polyangiaceae bacterium]
MPASAKTTSKAKRTRWIAERRLERRDTVGGTVIVRIGSPEWPPGAKEWRCPFMFEGLGDDSIHFGKSIDSMAALQNALIGIRQLLERTGIPLRWEGSDENYAGFPMDVPSGFGLAFQHRIEKMIETEIEELVRPIRERHERLAAQRKARKKTQAK